MIVAQLMWASRMAQRATSIDVTRGDCNTVIVLVIPNKKQGASNE